MNKREYTWYVEPIGDETNAVIHDYIKEKSIDAECKSIKCADGKKQKPPNKLSGGFILLYRGVFGGWSSICP